MRLQRALLLPALLAGSAAPAQAQADSPGGPGQPPPSQAAPARSEALPPDADTAKGALEKSPRHAEWVDVPLSAGAVPIRSWVVYPERKDKAGVVIVIHEIYGLTDWIRGVADQLARDGFIAVAPDLISGRGPGGGGTDSVSSSDDVAKLVRGLSADEVVSRLDAVRTWAVTLPAANGRLATLGFCWGGAASFNYATSQAGLDAAVVYYGSSPAEPARLAAIKAPILGLYGGDDARVNVTIEPAAAEMKKHGKVYETHIYEGAGHGFLRQQAGREGANMAATRQAWPATIQFLGRYLK